MKFRRCSESIMLKIITKKVIFWHYSFWCNSFQHNIFGCSSIGLVVLVSDGFRCNNFWFNNFRCNSFWCNGFYLTFCDGFWQFLDVNKVPQARGLRGSPGGSTWRDLRGEIGPASGDHRELAGHHQGGRRQGHPRPGRKDLQDSRSQTGLGLCTKLFYLT